MGPVRRIVKRMSQNGNAVLAADQGTLLCGEMMFWFAKELSYCGTVCPYLMFVMEAD
jgi:hypothetical protein